MKRSGRALAVLFLGCCAAAPVVSADDAGRALDAGMANPGAHDQPEWFKQSFLDIREDVAEAARDGKRVLLFFYQDGCPYCAKLLRENFGDRSISEKTRQGFDVIAINMWGDREVSAADGAATTEKRFAADLGVQFTPTLLFLDEKAAVVLRINGYFPPHKFSTALDYVAGKRERSETFQQFYAAVAPPPASGKLHPLGAAMSPPLRLADRREESGRHLVVLFEQKQCAPCDELHGDVLRRVEVASSLSNLDAAQLDLWSDEKLQTPDGRELGAAAWARELGIQFAPSLVFFDSEGREVFRTEAYLKTFHVHGALDYVSTGAYRRQPSFQRFLQARAATLESMGFHIGLME